MTETFRDWFERNYCDSDKGNSDIRRPIIIRFTMPRQLSTALPEMMLVVYENVPNDVLFTWMVHESDATRANDDDENTSSESSTMRKTSGEADGVIRRRTARAANDEMANSAGGRSSDDGGCTLHRWYIDFTKMKWDRWVLTPKGYNANYCSGSCTGPTISGNSTITNHAYIKNLYLSHVTNSRDMQAVPRALCVPIKLSPMNLLFHNGNGTIIIRHMAEMVADACACL